MISYTCQVDGQLPCASKVYLSTVWSRALRDTVLQGMAKLLTEPPHTTHLVPPKRMILSPTLQQHCRRRGHGPFPLGSIFLQERETKGQKRVHQLVTRAWPRSGYRQVMDLNKSQQKQRPTAPQTPTSQHSPSLSTSSSR